MRFENMPGGAARGASRLLVGIVGSPVMSLLLYGSVSLIIFSLWPGRRLRLNKTFDGEGSNRRFRWNVLF